MDWAYTVPRTLGLAIFGALFGSLAMAQPQLEHFGALELAFDPNNWRIERPTPDIMNVVPIDAMAKIGRPVVVTQAASNDLKGCEALARAQLPGSLYNEPTWSEVDMGGVKAIAMHGRTRCRNATPAGMTICIPYRGVAYVLTDRITSCRTGGRNPFSGSGWFEDLTRGIRFAP